MDARMVDLSRDYATIASWYKNQGIQPPVVADLSTTGIIVEKDGKPLAACWVYMTNSQRAWFDNLSSDLSVDKKERSAAVEFVMLECARFAKSSGYSVMYAYVEKPKILERIKRLGAKVLFENVAIIGKVL